MEVEYKVKKTTTVHKQCQSCGGTGTQKVKRGGYLYSNPCTSCKQGVTTAYISTEVTLTEALKDLGFIK